MCSIEDVFQALEQTNMEWEQSQPVVEFGSFPPMPVNMVYVLPQEFQAEEENQERQEDDPIPISCEDSQTNMVQDESEVTKPMEIEDKSEEEVSINLSYPNEYPTTSMQQHVKPLYIKAFFDEIQMNRVLEDNRAAVNLFPKSSLKKLGKGTPD